MSLGRSSVISISIALCVALIGVMYPAVAIAQDATVREYIVTLDVQDSNRNIRPTSRANRVRLRQRAKAASEATQAVTRRQGVKAGHAYGNAVTGFSARMTRAQARRMARDPSVSSVRLARTFKVSGQSVPIGVRRVKAYQASPKPNVQGVNVAVVDTGVGPAFGNGRPRSMLTNELNIRGGINCFDDPFTKIDDAAVHPEYWGDIDGHGTHIAGIIGARDNALGVVGVAPGASLWSVRTIGPLGGSESGVLCGLDWIIGTHFNDIPDIDVVNMSIEGDRLDDREDCDVILSDPPADPIHQKICTLKAMGVPVVASAGNSGIDANSVAPAGYDQTITVGAMTDTDGRGWEKGGNAKCPLFRQEKDDTYADYSNHGADIDIVAPGTCVWSTWYGDRTGDRKVPMSGTSMAAPLVTGAIARYIDARGNPSSVGEMRQLIRASGRMDWDARTDPTWFGVNDTDPPNRVLDVAALTGGPAVRTWVYHQGFIVGGTDDSRTTRVDVQRSGGYAGRLNLSASGLPGSAGSAAFDDDSLEGLGRNDLGTNLVFSLDSGGGEGIHDVDVTANGGGVSPFSRALELIIDRTPPEVWKLGPKVRGKRSTMSKAGTTKVVMKWNPKDQISGVASAQLQRRIDGGSWTNASSGRSSGTVSMRRGQDNDFRVRATDRAGNQKTGKVVDARLWIRDSKDGALQRTGKWRQNRNSGAYGGSLLVAKSGTPTVRTTFEGEAVAVVAPVGSDRGTFRVRVDGGAWSTVNTKSGSAAQRRIVWSRRLKEGTHTMVIKRVSGRPAIDAIIFVR